MSARKSSQAKPTHNGSISDAGGEHPQSVAVEDEHVSGAHSRARPSGKRVHVRFGGRSHTIAYSSKTTPEELKLTIFTSLQVPEALWSRAFLTDQTGTVVVIDPTLQLSPGVHTVTFAPKRMPQVSWWFNFIDRRHLRTNGQIVMSMFYGVVLYVLAIHVVIPLYEYYQEETTSPFEIGGYSPRYLVTVTVILSGGFVLVLPILSCTRLILEVGASTAMIGLVIVSYLELGLGAIQRLLLRLFVWIGSLFLPSKRRQVSS